MDRRIEPTERTLGQREQVYGDFRSTAECAQHFKNLMRQYDNFHDMSSDKQEALDLVATKLSRILTGDPDYADNWHDIAGYAVLAEQGC